MNGLQTKTWIEPLSQRDLDLGWAINFIGHEKEIDQIQRLLSPTRRQPNSATPKEVRLVTLTGPGGVGKTRLAIQVGYELVEL